MLRVARASGHLAHVAKKRTSVNNRKSIKMLPGVKSGKVKVKSGGRSATMAKKDRYLTMSESFQMRRVLRFGNTINPQSIVVVFHGCGDNAIGTSEWADYWAQGLGSTTMIVVPESNECVVQDETSPADEAGRDWLRHLVRDFRDQDACIRVLQQTTRKRMRHVNRWLDTLLADHRLTNQDLTLVGFSQGCVLAAIAGASRGVKAVAMFGGVGTEPVRSLESKQGDLAIGRELWPRWEDFMPKAAPHTKFWALEGTKDTTVPRKKIESLMAPYDVTWRYEKGLLHWQLVFYKRFRNHAMNWMKSVQQC